MNLRLAPLKGLDWVALDPTYPTASVGFDEADHSPTHLPQGGTHFGFVLRGPCEIAFDDMVFPLRAGMYFSAPSAIEIRGGAGLVVTRLGEQGLFALGGPVEADGRLQYMDGCTDTLLLSPSRLGEACLNLLVLPPGTRQRMHEHPSVRVGVVASGHGRCVTESGSHVLSPGVAFALPAGLRHCFHTEAETLRVIAYHPDSDFGPTDENHPMRNRTIKVAP